MLHCLLLIAGLEILSSSAHAETRKFALVVGNNRGHNPSEALRYAELDAKKIHQVLTEFGGFPNDQTMLLLGADADSVRRAINRMKQQISKISSKQSSGDGVRALWIFYYSGHAEGDVLELGDSSLRFSDLGKLLKSSPADVRVAFIDSCQSGRLISTKGGRRGPSFDIHITDEINSKGYAIITSSADNELSQESAEIRGGFFTHYLVSGLRGAGDASRDGKVTLNEAYKYAYSRTLARTSATIGGSQHAMYHFQLEGRGDIVLTNIDRSGSHIAVNGLDAGRLVLLDERGETIVAEVESRPNHTEILAVRPGEYTTFLVTPPGAVLAATAHVVAGRKTVLNARDFQATALKTAVAKGGLFPKSETGWTHRVGVGGLWRLFALEGRTASYGMSVHYRPENHFGLQPVARLTWTRSEDAGLSTGYNDVAALAGMGYLWSRPLIALRVEVLLGYEHLFQNKWAGESRHTSGFSYLGLLGLEIPIGNIFVTVETGVGGRVFRVMGKGIVHRVDLQAALCLGWKWSSPR